MTKGAQVGVRTEYNGMQCSGMQWNATQSMCGCILERSRSRSRSRMKPRKCSLISFALHSSPPLFPNQFYPFSTLLSRPVVSAFHQSVSNISILSHFFFSFTIVSFYQLFSLISLLTFHNLSSSPFSSPLHTAIHPLTLTLSPISLLLPSSNSSSNFHLPPSLSTALSPVYWCSQRTHRAEQPSPP
jgi:hypothetical protein